ncbi:hypothetical protein Uis1B_1547 [Bifidobacterium margollesii]|uniref:Uncharacterized protein n=1 Tax=Bifidobacterium margollesii TaxID=2020964 RepID=A0A2N5J8T6_9BIFI|nr:hypothetical protein [Bifidobacterium margollesii]PLS30627.1 hypothetical protein Uis1B_1547 [Bifidobacterium margollesii]
MPVRFEEDKTRSRNHYVACIIVDADMFENHEQTATDERFFGSARTFKKNYLKKVRKHQLPAQ